MIVLFILITCNARDGNGRKGWGWGDREKELSIGMVYRASTFYHLSWVFIVALREKSVLLCQL